MSCEPKYVIRNYEDRYITQRDTFFLKLPQGFEVLKYREMEIHIKKMYREGKVK